MPRIFYSSVLSLLAAFGGTTTTWGTELETEARLAALEREFAELQSQSQAAAGLFSTDRPEAAFEAGAELTLLRLHIGSLVLRDFAQDRFAVTPSYDLDAAFRVWMGRQGSNGLGWRVSYWKFDDTAELEFTERVQNATLTSGLDLYTVDLELTRGARMSDWDIFSTIGVRIGGIDTETAFKMDNNVTSFNQNFTGAGLTLSVGTQHGLGSSNWSMYGGFRGSLLYGVTNFDATAAVDRWINFDGGLRGSVAGQTVSVLELQLGLQYERSTRFGLFFGRAGVETQLWELPPVVLGIGDQNVGLFGPTFLVGLRR